MEKIYRELKEKRSYYAKIWKEAEKSLRDAPEEGRLRVANRKGTPQYYLLEKSGDTKGTYITHKNLDVARKLAQRDYDRTVAGLAEKYCRTIEDFLKLCPKEEIAALYSQNPGRRSLIRAYELSDEEFAQQWQDMPYKGKNFSEGAPEIYTNRGERVRSKTEKMIADKLLELKIPYRYEYPLYLRGYGTVYPDFVLLHPALRKEIILEHLGMMDQPEYCAKALEKISTYERNDIFLGDRLLLTFETAARPLDTRTFQKMLQQIFLFP